LSLAFCSRSWLRLAARISENWMTLPGISCALPVWHRYDDGRCWC
jgi:hypothetical protein